MSMTEIRSIVVSTQETLRESGTSVSPATVKVIAAAVVTNPLAGKALVQDLTELEMMSIEVTAILADRAVKALEALGLSAADIRGYGIHALAHQFARQLVAAQTSFLELRKSLDLAPQSQCQLVTKMTVGNSMTWIRPRSQSAMLHVLTKW